MYTRDECYKVEKNLLIFGWSRWSKILKHCDFSSRKKCGVQTEQDVENLARTIIAYALKNYHGDESIKQFMIELIDPSKSNFDDLKNHHGLAAPVGRAKKPKSKSSSSSNAAKTAEDKSEKSTEAKAKKDDEEEEEVEVEKEEKPKEEAEGEDTKTKEADTPDEAASKSNKPWLHV